MRFRKPGLALSILLLAAPAALAGEPWGTDTNEGDGPRLVEAAAAELAPIVAAEGAERTRLVEAYASGKAADRIEAVKRFRNPELHELFVRLASHPDWKIRHRALFALEYYRRSDDLPLAFAALADPEPRLREKAAIAAIKLFDAKAAKDLDGDPEEIVAAAIARETDPHVLASLKALAERIDGKLPMERTYTEHLERRPDGLLVTPFLSGMNTAAAVAPGYSAHGVSKSGGASASKLPAGPYTTPLVLFGEEARSGLSLQPFANLRGGGSTYHTGLDVGGCLDGTGFHAIAPGIVKFVHSGSDMGTLVVVQSHLGDRRTVNAVYMHGGDTVFVKAGDEVESGQLLGTMGMGYSLENGGHYAHLHFGLYPGEFSATHNYGYRAVRAGLSDWYDPARYVPLWVELTRPLVPLHRSQAALGKAAEELADDEPGKAYDAAKRQGEAGEALRAELEKAAAGAVARAEAMRDRGYPTRALEFLERYAKAAKGIPGADAIADAAKEWKRDKDLKAAMKDERRIAATEDEAIALAGRPAEAVALWEKLLKSLGDSCLAPRVKVLLEGVGYRP